MFVCSNWAGQSRGGGEHPPQGAVASEQSPPRLVRNAQVKAWDDRAQALSVRNSYVSTQCPVVICPYLCTSELAALAPQAARGRVALAHLGRRKEKGERLHVSISISINSMFDHGCCFILLVVVWIVFMSLSLSLLINISVVVIVVVIISAGIPGRGSRRIADLALQS